MVTSNVDAVFDGHVGNHARFVRHDVVYFIFSVSIRASPYPSPSQEPLHARRSVPTDDSIFVICLIASVLYAEASQSPLTMLRTPCIPAVGACCFPATSPPTLAAD